MDEVKQDNLIGPRDPFVRDLCKALGLPKRTVSFALRVEMDHPVKVDCTYYPSSGNPDQALTETFELVRTNGGKG